ncbi:MAG: malto-oligosyltrehalose synthase [Acidiphilium sp. 37-64-53]|uniref:malto-oligosyltrehalose synthase n=1 Tax=Acidiphilium TaxID=522 RepID=UPI000BCF727C|nr:MULTISPECIES: malto-oligosyltrehalose synthase [Acidiphilium]OYW03459.1 MAG: malto-oligosyltrehalose synthase [Acidiphilium sp. 37-64-53]OZB30655.1 MAG: malto-oligosyltrehalose synthase [Acidiphilium sp. 34-64-41]HQT84813.1 malto-oligosyltrehalose synthase [Acidiphilium rubrum]
MTHSTSPRATIRLQFHKGFTLDDGAAVIPYAAALGMSHLYASPILKARPGSTHGYDIVDHTAINPELGGEAALERLSAVLRDHGMGLILDIVPNHMGVGGSDNQWWMDVLEWGRASRYADAFDIDWTPPDRALYGKIMAPFLGESYGAALQSGDLRLSADAKAGRISVVYHEHEFPLSPAGMAIVLKVAPRRFADAIAHFTGAADLIDRPDIARPLAETARARLIAALATPHGEAGLVTVLARYEPTTPDGIRRLHELLETQNYRLAYWRAAADEINWRRFFDINTLAGIRAEIPWVFDQSHKLILDLYARGVIDGVRVDHVDGLADPRAYCRKLRRALTAAGKSRPSSAAAGPPYIIVEKILAPHERLRADWLTDGTTGYDFMNEVAAVLHDPDGGEPLAALWHTLTGRSAEFDPEERDARRQVLRDNLTSEWNGTAALLHRLAGADLATRDISLTALRRALAELLVHFPIYRIYAGAGGSTSTDEQTMDWALARARRSFRVADRGLLNQIRHWLADRPLAREPLETRALHRRAMVRFQQLSAPVAAKSVEDTAFYRYGRLISRNEVGSTPAQFALTPGAFHAAQQQRAATLPHAMLATATHDHKRGEDTRIRLAVLSEIPDEWQAALARWMRLNSGLTRDLDAGRAPSEADEIMLYQTLIAAWPLGAAPDGSGDFCDRVWGWWEKSIREAKLRSEWAAPDEAYEDACRQFLDGVFDTGRATATLGEIAAFARRIGPASALNGLAQTVLKYTVPGVPDLYQGTEFWDQSLVDPDNRRPVDFPARVAALSANRMPSLDAWENGDVKQRVIARLLSCRAEHPSLFAEGGYTALDLTGTHAAHGLAFARTHGTRTLIVAVSRLAAPLLDGVPQPLIPPADWGDTALDPAALPGPWRDVLTGGTLDATGGIIPLSTMFATLPVAVLIA